MNKVNITIADIDSSVPELPVPLCFTETALQHIAKTIGSQPPETGAFAFAPFDRFGIEVVEFDSNGSRQASATIYTPDDEWAEQRRKYWIEQDPPKTLVGGIHSHPADIGRPSQAVGEGLGDLGYAAAVFAANEALQYFAIPIVTRTGTNEPRLYPWVAVRDGSGVKLFKAVVRVCTVEEFPPAVYSPAWEASIGNSPASPQRGVSPAAAESAISSRVSVMVAVGNTPELLKTNDEIRAKAAQLKLDVDRIANLIEGDARLTVFDTKVELVTLRRGVILKLALPPDFPQSGPTVFLPTLDYEPLTAPQNWRHTAKGDVEVRLAKLVNETVKWLGRAS